LDYRLLFDSVFNVIYPLAKGKIYFSEICANAYTEIGHSLCKTFNMKFICNHYEHGAIYYEKIEEVIFGSLLKENFTLVELYKNSGLIKSKWHNKV